MEGDANYAWEQAYKRSWDVLQEDESGSLDKLITALQNRKKKRAKTLGDKRPKKGVIRHLYLILDLSRSMTEVDLKPTRLECTLNVLRTFIGEYFDQNPLSQMGIIVSRNGLAEKVLDLCAQPRTLVERLESVFKNEPLGEPSLQNSLELARAALSVIPAHNSREILVIYSSLTSCDPGDITLTADSLKVDKIRVSIVSLSAELHVCKKIAKQTNGTHHVILNESHFNDLVREMVYPPLLNEQEDASNLVRMGFPIRMLFHDVATLCSCHLKTVYEAYKCPNCSSIACSIPSDCSVCGLSLISSPLLARSYHHLFPVKSFDEVEASKRMEPSCASCLADVAKSGSESTQCPECKNVYCHDCDLFIHDILHNCPGCLEKEVIRRR